MKKLPQVLTLALLAAACGNPPDGGDDGGAPVDAGHTLDAGHGTDAGETMDAGEVDAGEPRDAGETPDAGESTDAGETNDAGTRDGGAFTIYMVGDSTMALYDPGVYPDQRGWGQMFANFIISPDVTLVDAARNGRSSRSFYLDPANYWPNVRDALQPGDYVLVQFAHNDELFDGLSTESFYGVTDITTTADPTGRGTDIALFKDYLGRYINETRAHGATPILVTPVVRRYFSGTTLTAKALHDLSNTTALTNAGASVAIADGNYAQAMRDVGASMSVPVIDLTASTRQLVESYGPTQSKDIIYIATDDTHLSSLGATLFAQLAVSELLSKNLFVGKIEDSANLVVSPTTADFGLRYLNTTFDKAFNVTGLSLTPDSGALTITAPAGFAVSATASGTFGASFTLPYTGGQLSPTTFYVRFAPTAAQVYAGDVTVAGANGETKTIAVTGTGASVPDGGTDSEATWPLISDITASGVTGLVTAPDQRLSGVYVKNYATITTWNPASTSTTAQRTSITGDTWPTETDLDPARYVEFTLTPTAGATLSVDAIDFFIGGGGGNKLSWRALYSVEDDFSNETVLDEAINVTSNTMNRMSYSPLIVVPPNKSLHLRIYPWLTATGTGKYLLLQNVHLHGIGQIP